MLVWSQNHLTVWDLCPQQYAYRYNEGLAGAFLMESDAQTLGAQFHQLRQQAELGLPIAAADPLHTWLQRFEHSAALPPGDRLAECRRTCRLTEDTVLTAVYDLLIVGDRTAHIYDWKTYREPSPPAHLAQSWQTRLYLFVLAETSPLPPTALDFTYWFTATGETVRISYSEAQHQKTRQDLGDRLRAFQQNRYPKRPQPDAVCDRCPYRDRCWG
ncbi:MAG: PD-(D/E)XK nuclease family protein [Pseudanabaenaceae cyanobacterium]